jgi:diguanylate cyclase (GGDEF)-like protein/PAS domain S-box-containing protein
VLASVHASLKSLFDGVPMQMGITELTVDQDMLLVSVNPAGAAFLGKTTAELQGKRISELGLEGPGAGVWLAQYLQALASGDPVNFETPSGKPGSDGWMDVTLAHIGPGPSGRPRFSWIAQDVSARKREERTQEALYQNSEAARAEGNLLELFRTIHGIIGSLLPAKNFFVVLVDKASNQLSFPYYVDEFDPQPAPRPLDDGTLSGRVIALGQSLLLTPETLKGIHEEDRVVGTPSLDWLGVPLKTKAGTLGALVVQSYDGDVRYLEKDKTLLEFVSGQVAAAIEHRQLTDALSWQAHHDALTGLPNRVLFQDRLQQALAMGRRKQTQVAVLYMDIDRFKHINDTLGHSAGDELLRQTTQRLEACMRDSDTLARLGGDEFTVVLGELQEASDAMRVAHKMAEAMRVPFTVHGRELFMTMSLGISVFPGDADDAESLLVNADVAMYRAKDSGRDHCQWYAAEMTVVARERMELESQLRHALQLGQLSLDYQPQCNAAGDILGFEALMRWRHPTLGNISPVRFIPLAEESGLIVSMGEWALREACAQAAKWRAAGHAALRMSVNVSAVQFKRPDWVDTVRRALHHTGLAPEALELEITESLLLQSVKETSANLFELRALGVGIAIDDFGTGYSSLSYLHRLPITSLKIDQSFVREIGAVPMDGHEDAPIIRTIIALAHNLGLSVTAEGVETEAQRSLLVGLGCEALQGFLLHRALVLADAEALLARRAA